LGERTYLLDSKPIPVCKPIRHGRVRLLREEGAYFGKTSVGWFFGFKLHLLVHTGWAILAAVLTPGNRADQDAALSLAQSVAGGSLEHAQVDDAALQPLPGRNHPRLTISRLGLIKIAARVKESLRRVQVELCSSCPSQALWRLLARRLGIAPG